MWWIQAASPLIAVIWMMLPMMKSPTKNVRFLRRPNQSEVLPVNSLLADNYLARAYAGLGSVKVKTYYEDKRAPRREPMLMRETIVDCSSGFHVVSPVVGSVSVPNRRVKSSKTRKPEIWPVSYLSR